ncbi:MAG: cupin domain-containing protein [Christensenella sp.]
MVIGKHKAETVDKLGGCGKGNAQLYHWLGDSPACPNLALLSTITLERGATVGDHAHHGEAEVYFITQGSGEYNDNGKTVDVAAGDVTICYKEETHGLKNTGDGELVFHAIIIEG